MKLISKTARAAFACTCLTAFLTTEPLAAEEVHIFGIDISDSVPVTVNRNIAMSAGTLVENRVARLQPGDEVKIRSFGAASVANDQINIRVVLGRKARERAERVAPALGDFVRSLPDLVESGKITLQTNTNIIGFVEAMAPTLDCQAQQTHLVLFTDAIEWSSQAIGNDILAGTANLPPPSGQILKGCIVEMRGVGQLAAKFRTDSRWFPILREQWRTFFEAAGVAQFSAFATYD
jgi:hypothetical protein